MALVAFCAAAFLCGCESMSSRMHERFTPVAPQTRIFSAERKVVYAAAQEALKNVGLSLGHKSLTEGRIDGYMAIRTGDNIHHARQTTMSVRLVETDALATRVELMVSEHSEGDFPGGVSGRDLREHSLYGIYFAALQQVLTEKGALKTMEKP